jgi:hypothetical protein
VFPHQPVIHINCVGQHHAVKIKKYQPAVVSLRQVKSFSKSGDELVSLIIKIVVRKEFIGMGQGDGFKRVVRRRTRFVFGL